MNHTGEKYSSHTPILRLLSTYYLGHWDIGTSGEFHQEALINSTNS